MIITEKYSLYALSSLQIISIVLFGLFVDYSDEASGVSGNDNSNTINNYYPFFQDVHVMIFIGFGFLMTFLEKYNFNSILYNFFIAAIAIQYTILINGFFHCVFKNSWHTINLDIQSLITGDFGAGAVLITFGALLGKTTLPQMIFICLSELVFYSVNESIGVEKFQAVDMGGSMYVHTFGAYFGLAVSWVITDVAKIKNTDATSSRTSDLFAMIGTLFLWIYWPSFNGALAVGNSQHRVVINTVLSLTNSCISAVIVSKLLRPHRRLSMVDIQNASLAGGVAVGSSADLVIGPFASLLIGAIAGTVSVYGYVYIQPYLLTKLNLHDTCGVHYLHGIPGIIGGISGAISSCFAKDNLYGDNIGTIFPAMADGRSSEMQGLYQLYALLCTIGIAIFGGLLTGKAVTHITVNNKYHDDADEWELEENTPLSAT
ncbi:ammonium transporter [bacterium]|nr:ammonium transporter [bacterium]